MAPTISRWKERFLQQRVAGLGFLCVALPSYVVAVLNGWRITAPLTGMNPTIVAFLLVIPFAVIARIYRRRTRAWQVRAGEFLASLPKSACRTDKALFLRTVADEVSNWLGVIYALTWFEDQAQLRTEGYLRELGAKRSIAA